MNTGRNNIKDSYLEMCKIECPFGFARLQLEFYGIHFTLLALELREGSFASTKATTRNFE